MKDHVDGTEFMCEKHGIDYRIVCDECQLKYVKLMKLIMESRQDYGKSKDTEN
jgi:hypothetical protein